MSDNLKGINSEHNTNLDIILNKGRKAFLKLRENAKENGTAGMSLDEINEVIYEHKIKNIITKN